MPSPARVHHLAPVEDVSMEETEVEVSAEETSAVEQDATQDATEAEAEAVIADDVAEAEDEVVATEVEAEDEDVSTEVEDESSIEAEVEQAASEDVTEFVSEDLVSEDLVSEDLASDETSSADEAGETEAPSMVDETASADEVASVADTASVAEAPSAADESAPIVDDAPPADPAARPEELRLLEAMLFAATEPLDEPSLAKRMPEGVDIKAALALLQADYSLRGVNLIRVANKWTFRTASDLSWLMTRESTETRRLSRAAIETLAIIAYHQPVTRAEIEEIRGVVTSKGTLDVLLETGWIRPRGRRKTPGRPLTFGTTEGFLSQFSLEALGDLPGLEELKGSGLLDTRLPTGFSVPSPSDDPQLREDEDPLEPGDLDLALAPAVEPEKDGES